MWLKAMEAESTWGDHITLQAMADILNCRINVLLSSSGEFISIQPTSESAEQRPALVLGYIDNLHYVALISKGLTTFYLHYVSLNPKGLSPSCLHYVALIPNGLIPFYLHYVTLIPTQYSKSLI